MIDDATRQEDVLGILERANVWREAVGVLERYGVGLGDVLGPRRYNAIARARHELWLLLRESLSYPDIGRLFDRDHTTVMMGAGAHTTTNRNDRR